MRTFRLFQLPRYAWWNIASGVLLICSLMFWVVAQNIRDRTEELRGAALMERNPVGALANPTRKGSPIDDPTPKATAMRKKPYQQRLFLNPLYYNNPLAELAAASRARVRFRSLYDKLRLSAEQIEQFERAVSGGEPSLHPLGVAERTLTHFPDRGSDNVNSITNELADRIASVVGPPAAEEFKRTIYASELQQLVDDVASALHYGPEPMTAEVGARLLDYALVASGSPRSPEGKVQQRALNWDTFAQSAASLLSEEQLRALEAIRAKSECDAQYQELAGRPAPRRLPRL